VEVERGRIGELGENWHQKRGKGGLIGSLGGGRRSVSFGEITEF
jgi:hypothetical protein